MFYKYKKLGEVTDKEKILREENQLLISISIIHFNNIHNKFNHKKVQRLLN